MTIEDNIKADMKMVHLAYAPTQDDADAWIKALAEHGIKAQKGPGIRDIYAIGDPVGIEILVLPDDAAQAADIIRQISGSSAPSGHNQSAGKQTLTWVVVCAVVLFALIFVRVVILKQ